MKNAIDSHESSSHGSDASLQHLRGSPVGDSAVASPREGVEASDGGSPVSSPVNAGISGNPGDSPTVTFVSEPHRRPDEGDEYADTPVNETDKTVISQRPIAPPAEFYRSTPLAELASTLEGKQLDHFSVETMIGGGGMGAVFRGVDTRLDRVVAVKVIPSSRRDAETLRRFRLEAQAAARLDHPNIARVYYVGEADEWNYIVFEFIDGINIRDLVALEGPLSIDDAVFYTRQVAEALQHAHEREVVHRDVKPSNVLVTASGIAKLVDMGLARDTSLDKSTADATASGVTLGTFDYISPEQARNPRDADVRSDLYSLGCTLFFMLTGRPPFPDGTALQKLLNHGSLPPPDPRQWRADISDQLYEMLMKLMAKKPQDRYHKPLDLVNDILLLAELENLPRSQGPSTLIIRPSVAQRSLLETHLPWIVGTAALLGSALWLQSIQSLPGDGLLLPPLKFTETSATSSANGAPRDANIEQKRANELPTSPPPRAPSSEQPSERAVPSNGSSFPSQASSGFPNPVPTSPAESGNSSATNDPQPGLPSSLSLRPKLDAVDAAVPPGVSQSSSPGIFGATGVSGTTSNGTNGVRGSVLVVSESRPAEIASEQWESSLVRAVQRFADQPGTLEIRGTLRLEQPLDLENSDIEMVAYPGTNAVIQVSEAVFSGANTAALRLVRSKLRSFGLQWQVVSPSSVADATLFRVSEGSSLDLDRSTIRLSGSGKPRLAVCELVAVDGSRGQGTSSTNFTGSLLPSSLLPAGTVGAVPSSTISTSPVISNAGNSNSILISLDATQVFGNGLLIRIDSSVSTVKPRVELSIEESLVAVSGNALRLDSLTGDASSERILRILCKQTSFITYESFAALRYSGQRQPLLGLSRTSQGCAYWSPMGVSHIVVYGDTPGLLENPNLLALQGFDNAYDDNIASLCQTYSNGTNIFDMDFADGQQEGWYNERIVERQVRWLKDPSLASPFYQATPVDFTVERGMFEPGFPPELQ